jgi:uncharacterized protein YndB with AHSA1/START domain
MTKPSYVYVTYIATTPEKVWQAIVDPAIARQFWIGGDVARVNVSDWKVGSKWEHTRDDGSKIVDIAGKVVESTPPKRLVITWHRPKEANEIAKHSSVTFDIERLGPQVRLTITHDGLENDAPMLAGISSGWPVVLSNLKTLLETGKALPRPEAAA